MLLDEKRVNLTDKGKKFLRDLRLIKNLPKLDARRNASDLTNQTAEAVKNLVLAQFHDLDPSPTVEMAYPISGNGYKRSRKIKGLLIEESTGPLVRDEHYIVLRPDGLCRIWGSCTSSSLPPKELPPISRGNRTYLPSSGYVQYQTKIFDALERAARI